MASARSGTSYVAAETTSAWPPAKTPNSSQDDEVRTWMPASSSISCLMPLSSSHFQTASGAMTMLTTPLASSASPATWSEPPPDAHADAVTASTASPATQRARVPPDVFRIVFRPLSGTQQCVRPVKPSDRRGV